jgi:signal transduction histidine kinase
MSEQSIETVLLIEDNLGDARLLREMFNEHAAQNAELTLVASMSEAEKHLLEHSVDVILLDLGLPDAQGLEAIRRARTAAPRAPLVVLTGRDDESLAAQALQEGAQDYLVKGQIDTRGLLRALRYAIERKRLERLKDEFIATVSHELRTPLTSISASLGLLMGKTAGNLPDPAVRLLTIAHTNSQRLVRLVNDILDIEKMDSGQVVFNFGRVEVQPLLEQAMEANRGFAEGYGVRIRLEDAFDVGYVRADPDRLVQVITNLLSNAIKFSPAGNEVVIAVHKRTDVVGISVRDHGSGISVDFKPHIFERFAQADATNARQKGGTGLGLSIVKQIVNRLGGEVGFEDAPAGGTIFYVTLPCWGHMAGLSVDLDAPPDALRILLCEDDIETAVAVRAALGQAGFATDFAYAIGDATARATATRYHAVLVDLQLADGDGISVIVRLRELPEYRDTPIIVVSADPRRGREDLRSSRLKVSDWLHKPIDFEHLIRVLTKSVLYDPNRRPRILQVDDDNIVAQALSRIADVISVNSIEEAQRALKTGDFDLAVLDTAHAAGANLDLLPDLRDSEGNIIPVVVFSTQIGISTHYAQVQFAVTKSRTSVDNLVATVSERLASRRHIQRRRSDDR